MIEEGRVVGEATTACKLVNNIGQMDLIWPIMVIVIVKIIIFGIH